MLTVEGDVTPEQMLAPFDPTADDNEVYTNNSLPCQRRSLVTDIQDEALTSWWMEEEYIDTNPCVPEWGAEVVSTRYHRPENGNARLADPTTWLNPIGKRWMM
jgi:hypothetical protein